MSDSTPKSCANCPSFLQAAETVSKFRKSVGAPMCGRYGTVLGKPGLPSLQAEKLHRSIAGNCDAYGEPLPALPIERRLTVVMPDMDARTVTTDQLKLDSCRSCDTCTKYVREDIVADELGWTAGLCAAKGKLILSNRKVEEASGCEFREWGPIRLTTDGLPLLPEYEDAFQVNANPIKAWFKTKENFVDPVDYPSDRAVSDEDAAAGIRAWRKINDPEGTGREVHLPIYRLDFFSEAEQKKIPRTGSDEHPELYVDHFGGVYLAAVSWTELDETPTAWGEAGVGKTELFRHLAWLMCLPFERMSITASTELDDLIGKMLFLDGETKFSYGRLPLAWTKPCVICIDEPNTGPVEVWQRLRPLTDNSKQLIIDENDHENLDRNDDCYLGLAMNPAWDPKNVGALPISDADANRLFHVYIDLPPISLEREIIQNRVNLDGWELTSDQLDTIMNIAGELRGLSKEGTLPITWGIRPQIKVARALAWFDVPTAYRRAVGDYLEPEPQQAMLDIVRSHI